jgi:hypothetical protein
MELGGVTGTRWFLHHFLNASLGALSVEESEMLNDLMPFLS